MGLFDNASEFAALRQELAVMNVKLDAILQALNIEVVHHVDADVQELVDNGQVIEAIRVHRQRTGLGLKEAKDYVDSLRR